MVIHCLLFLPFFCRGSMFDPYFVMHYLMSFLSFAIDEEERAGFLTVTVFLMS